MKLHFQDYAMEDQRFLFLFDFRNDTYAMMWDTVNKFVYLLRQSDGKTTDGFSLPGLNTFRELRVFKDNVVTHCKILLDRDNYFRFQ